MVDFFVPGHPRTQGSKRKLRNGGFIEAGKYFPEWRKAVIEEAKKAAPVTITGAVVVGAEFVFPRPQRLKRKPTTPLVSGGDVDKLQRAIGDALTIAEAIEDDRFIVEWDRPRKRYAEEGEPTGAHITITPLNAGFS